MVVNYPLVPEETLAPEYDAIIEDVTFSIKKKKELSGLDDEYVRERIKEVLKKEQSIRKKVEGARSFREFSRSKEYKELKRLVREELRAVYGIFKRKEKRKKNKEERKSRKGEINKSKKKSIEEALGEHQSSRERLPHYEEIYQKIFSITGKPKIIIDLGCGANPYSYGLLGCSPTYIAVDLPNDELERIREFFKAHKIRGETHGLNLVNDYEKVSSLPNLTEKKRADMAFLFKLLDSLERTKRNISYELLDAINAAWLVVSFPKVSIGGKKHIKKERRAWFEKLLARKEWRWREFEVENEVFYVIKKR